MFLRCAKIALCKQGGDIVPDTERLKTRMRELRITQENLAKQLDLATPIISQKINNNRPFYLEEAEKVARILKISNKDFGLYFFGSDLHSAK